MPVGFIICVCIISIITIPDIVVISSIVFVFVMIISSMDGVHEQLRGGAALPVGSTSASECKQLETLVRSNSSLDVPYSCLSVHYAFEVAPPCLLTGVHK